MLELRARSEIHYLGVLGGDHVQRIRRPYHVWTELRTLAGESEICDIPPQQPIFEALDPVNRSRGLRPTGG